MTHTQLNENEVKVLKACWFAIWNFTNCEFGLTDEVHGQSEGLTKSQIKGYLSILESKEFIVIHDMKSMGCKSNQLNLTYKAVDYLSSLTTDEKELENLADIKANISE